MIATILLLIVALLLSNTIWFMVFDHRDWWSKYGEAPEEATTDQSEQE